MATTQYNLNRGYIGNVTPSENNDSIYAWLIGFASLLLFAQINAMLKLNLMERLLDFLCDQRVELFFYSTIVVSALMWVIVRYVSPLIEKIVHK